MSKRGPVTAATLSSAVRRIAAIDDRAGGSIIRSVGRIGPDATTRAGANPPMAPALRRCPAFAGALTDRHCRARTRDEKRVTSKLFARDDSRGHVTRTDRPIDGRIDRSRPDAVAIRVSAHQAAEFAAALGRRLRRHRSARPERARSSSTLTPAAVVPPGEVTIARKPAGSPRSASSLRRADQQLGHHRLDDVRAAARPTTPASINASATRNT